ncbi:hypothetical protein O3Q51_18240, partial [Cryomorphaceae bacterium 1068]|nr:hypothetical protein [Cryomorphaceae bacterium 1068]
MTNIRRVLIVLVLSSICSFGMSQRGPGGVSEELSGQSTCRAWLDASTMTNLADGDPVILWPDVSLSLNSDDATPEPNGLPPVFRDDPANTINGYPVVTFEENQFLLINPTTDLNLGGTTTEKTVFMAFRTSTDVVSKQIVYEEGGCYRGFNVYIDSDSLIIGGYDLNQGGIQNDGTTDFDNTPQWGYTYVSRKIDPNSTYILTIQFNAPQAGAIYRNDPDYYIKGWLNGQVFDEIRYDNANLTNTNGSNTGINGIGTLSPHPDPIGLGAVNSAFVGKDGLNCNVTGTESFQGRLAELCYYNESLKASKRIIIENYLGAKYFANIIQNDKYDHQAAYGKEVIGIGQQPFNPSADPALYHDRSQGRNPFEIGSTLPSSAYSAADRFFLTGHNGQNLLYTSAGVPANSAYIRRLQRIWRIDERNSFPSVTLKVNENDLPPKPAGFSKLVLLIDEASPNFPNFTLSDTKVLEISKVGIVDYEIAYDFQDNSFFTLAWLKPTVQFAVNESFGIETNPLPDSTLFTVDLSLNFLPDNNPSNIFAVDYVFVDGSASSSLDYGYDYSDQSLGIQFPIGQSQTSISVYVKNDLVAEDPSTENFLLILENGPNTTSGIEIGARDTLTFSIYDDDPEPRASFSSTTSIGSEGDPGILLSVVRTGDDSGTSIVQIRRKPAPDSGTATYGEDYTCQNSENWIGSSALRRTELIFGPGENIKTVLVTFLDDIVNETDETLLFIIEPISGISVDSGDILEHTVTLVDEDPEPTAAFLADNQTGYESVGDPAIFIELDRPSTRDVTVYYSITGGTASGNTVDYTAASSGPVLIQADDTLAFISPLSISNSDNSPEPDETIIFQLDSAENAAIGVIDEHTYTILDTSPFQWKGASGVGKDSDNIIWMDANRMSMAGDQSSLPNFSPRDIEIARESDSSSEAQLLEALINGRNAIDFRGGNTSEADCYLIEDNSFTNLAGFVEKKSYFFVIKPDFVPSVTVSPNATPDHTNCSLIYEQGGSGRGISIYLYNGYLWMQAWNFTDNGPQSPWGFDENAASNSEIVASTTWARSSQNLVSGEAYVVSCHYDNFSDQPIQVFVNGEEGIISPSIISDPQNSVGRLYTHGADIGLGAVNNQARFHFSVSSGGDDRNAGYDGLMAEFIKFHEPQMSPARRTILENYLSAKYNIPLAGTDTEQIFDLSFASGPNLFNQEVAGVGRTSIDDYHGDSQGTAILRVQNPTFSSASSFGYLVWGHNGEELTNTWPFSYWNADLPDFIEERSGQVWKIFESPGDPISTTDILINFSASDNAQNFSNDASLLKLLVHDNSIPQDFSNASVYGVSEIRNGFVAFFNDIPVTNGMYIALANTSPFSMSPLPLELLYFDAELKGTYVDLDWETATEINNDYFVVERASEDLDWRPILTVTG